MKIDGVPPKRDDERRYDREISEKYLAPYLEELARAVSQAEPTAIAWIAAITAVTARFNARMVREFPREAVEGWGGRVGSGHRRRFEKTIMRAAKVDIRPWMNEDGVAKAIKEAIDDSISYLTKTPDRFRDGLAEKVRLASMDKPLDGKDLERLFRQESLDARNKIRLITRDQTNKLAGNLSRIRQTNLGVTHYRWSTSRDDRVRQTHVDNSVNNGGVWPWSSPPPETGHPGMDIQCRCVAIPIMSNEEIKSRYG